MTPATRTLGDYQLLQLIDEAEGQNIWLAEQMSIARRVRLVELVDPAQCASFLADIRAQATVDHPQISSVYEAVDGDPCFAALEFIDSPSLAERRDDASPLTPREAAQVLRHVAETMLYLDAHCDHLEPLTLEDIHIDRHHVIRFKNPARSRPSAHDSRTDGVRLLGHELPALVADGLPGTNRVLTVLAWMRGEQLEAPIDWATVQAYGEEIEKQLQLAQTPLPAIQTRQLEPGRSRLLPWVLIVAALVAAAVAVWFYEA